MSFFHGCARWALACSFALFGSVTWGQSWPDAHWPSQPAPSSAALSALESYAFPARDDTTRSGVRSDALLVIRDGVLVYERYAAPTTASTPHLTWSMAKSLLASTLGVAYGQGLFRLDQPAAAYYPAFAAHPGVKLAICSTGPRAWPGRKTTNTRR